MNTDVIYRIQNALDLPAEAARLTTQELAQLAPDGYDLRQITKIQRRVEEAQGTIDTLESFL